MAELARISARFPARQLLPAVLYPEASDRRDAATPDRCIALLRGAGSGRRIELHIHVYIAAEIGEICRPGRVRPRQGPVTDPHWNA